MLTLQLDLLSSNLSFADTSSVILKQLINLQFSECKMGKFFELIWLFWENCNKWGKVVSTHIETGIQ